MKKNIFNCALLLCSVLLLLGCSQDTAEQVAETGEPSPADILANLDALTDPEGTMYRTLDNRALDLDVFAGKNVFINFWATWCAPCIREIPSINRAAETLSGENYVFLFASDEPIETIQAFLDEREFDGVFIKLNGYFGAHGIDAVPSSILINQGGSVAQSWAGAFEWDSPEMLDQIRGAVAL